MPGETVHGECGWNEMEVTGQRGQKTIAFVALVLSSIATQRLRFGDPEGAGFAKAHCKKQRRTDDGMGDGMA